LRKIEYKPAFEEVQFDDTPSLGVSSTSVDAFTSADDRFVDRNLFSKDEQVSSADASATDANLTTFEENQLSNDTPLIDDNLLSTLDDVVVGDTIATLGVNTVQATRVNDTSSVTLSPDELDVENTGSNDSVTTPFTFVAWDTNDWGSFDWTKEHN
jgi:hypothetical protein